MAPKQKKAAAEEPKARSRSPVRKEEPKKEEPKTEEPKKEEEPKFQEPDAPKDTRPAMKEKVGFDTFDTTLNVIPTVGGKVLACITDGGMANLIASARANCGQKSGRYMFEAKIIQVTDPSQGREKSSKQLVRIGFSTEKSNIILGADSSCVYFDSEGFCVTEKKKTSPKNGRFAKDQVVAVVLNLDSKSPNANTVALYRDGVACGDPVALPESLQGKPLFAHVAYRGVSLQVHFGPTNLKPLPFTCRMLQGAAASDVTVLASKAPKDGKFEVVMPVAFPDEGTFDWLDAYLEKNPQYVELSDRKIIEWAQASGMWSKASGGGSWKDQKASNDKPNFSFGVQGMDDRSVQRVLASVVPVVPRNYLIMEVKSNLIASERSAILKKFNYPCYKKVARVIMGEPSKEFTGMVHNKLLKAKQAKSDTDWKRKKAEVERKKQLIRKQKELAKLRKEAEKKRKVAVAEKKKAEEEKKAKEEEEKKAKETTEGGEAEKKEEEKKEEEKKDEPMEEAKEESEDEKEVADPMDAETEPPVAELTDEEKKVTFTAKNLKDLTPQVLSASFSKFTTPEMDEGFDDIQYEWQKAAGAKDYLKNWVLEKKLTTRIEDLRPGKEFSDKMVEFAKLCKEWQDKLKAFNATGKKAPAKKADDEAVDETDIYSVEDISDVGDGVPLFENFTFEDWELLKLRFNYCLLVLSFKKDCNDPDRVGIPLDHLGFYYHKYYHSTLNCKTYGVADISELLALIKDTVAIKDGLVVSNLSDDLDSLDILIKLTEEHRRERQRRIDAGDETARLKFVPHAEPKPAAAKPEAPAAAATAADQTESAPKGDKGKSWGKGGKGKGGKGKW